VDANAFQGRVMMHRRQLICLLLPVGESAPITFEFFEFASSSKFQICGMNKYDGRSMKIVLSSTDAGKQKKWWKTFFLKQTNFCCTYIIQILNGLICKVLNTENKI
jgi:hypothetical protein